MSTVTIRVVSDNVCPWCFVGKRNMEKAIKQFEGKLNFNIEYFPYSLHGNTMPSEGMDLGDYIYKVYGRRMNVNDPRSPLKQAGEAVGINFNNTRTMVNTLDSHRLIALSKKYDKHLDMVESIFHNYFEKAVNISKLDNLANIAENVLGNIMSKNEISEFLKGDEYKEQILNEIQAAKEDFITGVPSFTIEDPESQKKYVKNLFFF